jgi:hypothetical protein
MNRNAIFAESYYSIFLPEPIRLPFFLLLTPFFPSSLGCGLVVGLGGRDLWHMASRRQFGQLV